MAQATNVQGSTATTDLLGTGAPITGRAPGKSVLANAHMRRY